MKPKNFLLIAFLFLAAAERFVKYGPECILADFAPDTENNRKENDAMTEYQEYHRQNLEYGEGREKTDAPVRINYEPSKQEKCVEGRDRIKVTEPELSSEEVETVKKAAAKWQSAKSEKIKKPEHSTYRSFDQVIQGDSNRNKLSCAAEPKEGTTLCAECEKCEVQVKANGEGILLRCQECFQVPPNEIVFPAGNSRKIIKLP